jgi:archaemetzincin
VTQPPALAGGRLLGITDVDLFIPVLTFVFGEAQLEGPAAVVSVARLSHDDPEVTAGRLSREAVHELGHTFGLRHCANLEGGWRPRACVMARSPSVRAVDAKGLRLCGDCRERYRLVQQDGSHVYREHENPHR